MAFLTYTVTINTPEGEDDHNYRVTVGRNGMQVARIDAPLIPAMKELGEAIGIDLEENR